MRIDIMTLFPDMCEVVLNESIIGRARKKELIVFKCHNIRDYTQDKHRRVDDAPYSGGTGMVMQAQPIYQLHNNIKRDIGKSPHVIYMSPCGQPLTQKKVIELSKLENISILCGHYEGVDERLIEEIVDEEISIGDYVVTGGELPALILADAIARLLPGVLANEEAYTNESHYSGLLEHAQYTRPAKWKDKSVPEVLLSGHHLNIEKWKRRNSLKRTAERRPDLLDRAELSQDDKIFLMDVFESDKDSN